ncbi:MAG: CHRD domain-containing protein [Flavitalea sp.]
MKSATQGWLRGMLFLAFASLASCSKDDNKPATPTVLKDWTVPMNVSFENPSPAGRTETGSAELQLLSDNTLSYHIMISNFASGDAFTAGHLHAGDAITNGPVILNLSPSFTSGMATGNVPVDRQSLADSIMNNEVYINLHTTLFPGGLIRGQLNKTIDFALDVALTGDAEKDPVTTTATGTALIRMTSDKTLYSKLSVANLESDDALTAGHIHTGATGVNGPVLIGLAGSVTDFGIGRTATLTDEQYLTIKNDAVYVNAHSVNHPGGIIRGQIR